MKKYSLLIILYLLLIVERFYGIWFLRWAFDEEQNFGGGTAMLKWVLNLFGTGIPNPETEHLVSIYGIVGKYLAVVPAAMGFALEKVLPIDLPIPLGLIFTRIVVSFLPSVLTIVLIHKMIRLVSDSKVFLFSALTLFLFTFKHIETAHYGVSDGLSTFFVVWSVYCFLRFSLEGRRKFLVWTAVACVLAVATKVNVGVVITGVIGLLLLIERGGTEERKTEHADTETQEHIERKNERRDAEIGRFNPIVVFGFTWMAVFVVVNLPYLVNFGEWYGELERHVHEYPYTIKGTWLTPFYFHPPFGVGFQILLLALGGIYYGLRATKGRHWSIGKGKERWTEFTYLFLPALLFLILFYLYLVFSRGVIHRWTIPMTPFLVLFAAYFIEVTYRWSMIRFPVLKRSFVAVGISLLVFLLVGAKPLYHVLQFDLALTASSNTYQQLQKFADENLASNACIYNVEGIVLKNCSEEAPVDIAALKESSIEYIVFSDFWFSERRYPESILYLEVIDQRTHGNWRLIRNFIEGENSDWKLEQVIRPTHFSDWSTNIAQPPIFYIYKRNDAS